MACTSLRQRLAHTRSKDVPSGWIVLPALKRSREDVRKQNSHSWLLYKASHKNSTHFGGAPEVYEKPRARRMSQQITMLLSNRTPAGLQAVLNSGPPHMHELQGFPATPATYQSDILKIPCKCWFNLKPQTNITLICPDSLGEGGTRGSCRTICLEMLCACGDFPPVPELAGGTGKSSKNV